MANREKLGGETSAQNLVFRGMTLQDLDTIVQIERESFTAPWSEQAFRTELTHNHFARYMVMEQDGDIFGYGGMWLIVDEAHVTNIAVRAPHRGKGLGEKLLREMMRTAAWLGAVRMTLEVRVSNEVAQNLYRKLGFYGSGIRPGYYSDNREDALIMWADLASSDEAAASETAGATEMPEGEPS